MYFFFFIVKDAYDYQGRSFLHVPQDVGVNLKSDEPPEKCFIPKKELHTWPGHTKAISTIKWFPRSAHLLLSCGMDCRIKVSSYFKYFLLQTTEDINFLQKLENIFTYSKFVKNFKN